jgi:putative membrane protein
MRMFGFLFNPRYPLVLLVLFLGWATLWAIRPVGRSTWMLENALTAALLVYLVWSYRRFPLSNISYTLIFVFLCVHTVGSHYTYSLVPYDRWAESVFGRSVGSLFGWQRNHFDRAVHLLFGLLISYPIREIFMRIVHTRGFWGYYLPLDVTMSFSMLYELIEWAAASVFGGGVGHAYLGTQGDPWDAHKDMALASIGAVVAMSVVALINWKFDRNFGNEWRASFDATGAPPLGERKLAELLSRSAQGQADE